MGIFYMVKFRDFQIPIYLKPYKIVCQYNMHHFFVLISESNKNTLRFRNKGENIQL